MRGRRRPDLYLRRVQVGSIQQLPSESLPVSAPVQPWVALIMAQLVPLILSMLPV
jgi:hypothetical protein